MTLCACDFAARVVQWQREHGRHALPWQVRAGEQPDPYRVWLSEVMLQQTQVATVLGYFERFIDRLPNVAALAAATEDEVLALWTGLGYYSRARNLHRCARLVVADHAGRFPRSAAVLATLPGIGRSTAAAISAVCFGERVAILDGNVRRVLARVLAFDGDLSQPKAVRALWAEAERLLPPDGADMPAYTQGMMDLGATLCTRGQPACPRCPVQADCGAAAQGKPTCYPLKSRPTTRRAVAWWWLMWQRPDGAVWLARRPSRGIWAGLYGFPTFDSWADLQLALPDPLRSRAERLSPRLHALSHRDLHLHPVLLRLPCAHASAAEAWWAEHNGTDAPAGWFAPTDWARLGLARPVLDALTALQC